MKDILLRVLRSCLLVFSVLLLPGMAFGGGLSVCPQALNMPSGGEVRIPVIISGFTGSMGAFGVDFEFDSTFLTYDRTETSDFTAAFDFFDTNSLGPGLVRIGAFTDPAETPADPDTLGYVVLLVSGSAQGSAAIAVKTGFDDLQGIPECPGTVQFVGGGDPVSVCPVAVDAPPGGEVRVPITVAGFSGGIGAFGLDFEFDSTHLTYDRTEPSLYTAAFDFFDAELLSTEVVRIGAFTDPAESPADPDTLGYVVFLVDAAAQGSAIVSVKGGFDDLQGIAECSVSIPFVDDTPPPTVCPETSFAPAGSELRIPIVLTDLSGGMTAFGFSLQFDPTFLTYVRAERSGFTTPFNMFNDIPGAGSVQITGFSALPRTPADPDTLAYVVLLVGSGALGNASVMTTAYSGDLAGAADCSDNVQFVSGINSPSLCPEAVDAAVASEVRVPIVLGSFVGPMGAFGFDFEFDPAFLTYDRTERSGFTTPFDTFTATPLGGGAVQIDGSIDPKSTPSDPDTLAYVVLVVAGNAEGSAQTSVTNPTGDVFRAPDCSATMTFIGGPPPSVCPVAPGAPAGTEIRVPVVLENLSGDMTAFGFDLEFDSTYLIYDRIERSGLTDAFDTFDATLPLAELVHVEAATSPPETPADPDTLAYVVFLVGTAARGSAVVTARNFSGDIAGAPSCFDTIVFSEGPGSASLCPITQDAFSGAEVRIPVVLMGYVGGVETFGFRFEFESTLLAYLRTERSGFTMPFDTFSATLSGSGTVQISGSTNPPRTPSDPDTVAYVVFSPLGGAPENSSREPGVSLGPTDSRATPAMRTRERPSLGQVRVSPSSPSLD